jgi:ABC-type transport system involved in Fe-S cluster assembly fused permease/ATPase subunit
LIRTETFALLWPETVKALAVHKEHLVLEQVVMYAAMMSQIKGLNIFLAVKYAQMKLQ